MYKYNYPKCINTCNYIHRSLNNSWRYTEKVYMYCNASWRCVGEGIYVLYCALKVWRRRYICTVLHLEGVQEKVYMYCTTPWRCVGEDKYVLYYTLKVCRRRFARWRRPRIYSWRGRSSITGTPKTIKNVNLVNINLILSEVKTLHSSSQD